MELNDDILSIIAGLSHDTITLVSKIMRHGYFRKNGIWIKLRRKTIPVVFPEKFYKYKINLTQETIFGGYRYGSMDYVFIDTGLSKTYTNYDDRLLDHVCKNTVYAEKMTIKSLDVLQGPLRVHRHIWDYLTDKSVKILQKNRIKGCTLVISSINNITHLLNKIKDIDCHLLILDVSGKYVREDWEIIRSKISRISGRYIEPTKMYPNATSITIFEYGDLIQEFDRGKFPKLKKIIMAPELFILSNISLENIQLDVFVRNKMLEEKDYGEIFRNKINTRLLLLDVDHEHDTLKTFDYRKHHKNSLAMKKWGTGYLSILYRSPDTVEEFLDVTEFYCDFHLSYNISNSPLSITEMLEAILKSPTIYNGQIVKFRRNAVAPNENLVRLAIKVYERKNLYIAIDNIGQASYEDIEKYRGYKP